MGVSGVVNFKNLLVNSRQKMREGDPSVPENFDTTIFYSLSSAKKNCQVVIKIYDMEGNVVYQTTATQLCPGNYSFTWNGMTSSGAIAPTGIYTFDIIVNGKTPDGQLINEDKDQMRSQALTISDHEIQWFGETPIDGGATDLYYVAYRLQDTKPAYKAGVEVYDPNLNFIGSWEDGTAITPTWNNFEEKLLKVPSQVCGIYRFVFWAVDDHPELDKAHRRKPALEVNAPQYISSGANCYMKDLIIGSTEDSAKVSANYQRQAGYKKWAWWNGSKLVYEEMVLKPSSALDVIKPLRRAAAFSWYLHGLANSLGGVIPFGNSWIVPSRAFLRAILPRLGIYQQVPDQGEIVINGKRVYCISELFGVDPVTGFRNDLSNLVCALLIHCSADEVLDERGNLIYASLDVFPSGSILMVEEMVMSYPLYDIQGNCIGYLLGANFAGTIIGHSHENVSELRAAIIPAGVARAGAETFWQEVQSGVYFHDALKDAADAMTQKWDIYRHTPIYSAVGPQDFHPYGKYRALFSYGCLYDPWGRPWGGRTEWELRMMGSTP